MVAPALNCKAFNVIVPVFAAVSRVAVPVKIAVSKGLGLTPGAVAGVDQLVEVPQAVLLEPVHVGEMAANADEALKVAKETKKIKPFIR